MKVVKEKIIIDNNVKINFFEAIFNSAFFTGYIPKASGTFGSLVGVLFLFIPGFYNPIVIASSSLVVFIISMFSMKNMIKKYGDDPSVIVIDEVFGQWITLLIVYIFHHNPGENLFIIALVSFIAFRVFDILKIYPAKYFDNIKNEFGIMVDDLVASIYAGFVSSYIIYLIQKFY